MSFIDKNVLDHVNNYRMFLEQCMNSLILENERLTTINFFCSAEYKLFSIIIENVRMDLNYLLSLNPDYDALGFPAIKRNVRISIEAYYDLYNLVSDRSYLELLKYQSKIISDVSIEIAEKYKPFLKRKISNLNQRPLSIKEKSEIAKKKNNLDSATYEKFKTIATNSNNYMHPDLFVTDLYNKEIVLKSLILCDCQIIMLAFKSVNEFIMKNNAPLISYIDSNNVYQQLCCDIGNVYWIYNYAY